MKKGHRPGETMSLAGTACYGAFKVEGCGRDMGADFDSGRAQGGPGAPGLERPGGRRRGCLNVGTCREHCGDDRELTGGSQKI